MNIRTSAFRGLAILSLSVLGLAACDEKDPVTPVPVPEVTVTVTPANLDLQVGQTGDLVAIVGNSTNQAVTWSSSNNAVATVSATGRVTAVAPGGAVITATSSADPTKRAAAGVTVTAAPPPPVVTVSVTPSQASVNIGGSVTLVPTVTGTTNTAVTYTSSATNVATVSTAGVVTGVAAGTAVITVRSSADNTKTATAQITVVPNAPIVVTITPSQATTQVNGTVQFVATVSGTTNQNVTWASSATGVATITAGGLATGVSAGTAVITATSAADGSAVATAVLTVTALPPVTISVTPTTITNLGAGNSTQIAATITGSTNQNVTCTTGDASVATVAVNGAGTGCTVTGVAAGSTVITVASVADPTKTATVLVTVVGASVAIANIPAQPTAPGPFVINANVSVPAGTADFLDIILTSSTGVQYRVRCQTFTAAGAATTVTCPINPADYDPNTPGAQVLPNGTYTVRAELLKGANVAATATFGQQLTLNNTNTLAGTVTFANATANTDNTPDAPQEIAAGVVWNGGTATVVVTPSVFTGTAIATLTIAVDLNCDGVVGAAEPQRSVAAAADGTFTATFSETVAVAAAGGIEGVTAPICFIAGGAADANTLPVTVPAGAGTGQISTIGTAAGTVAAGALNVDNVPAVYGALALPPSMTAVAPWPVLNWAGSATAFGTTGADAVAGTPAVDAGVGGVVTTFYAVPAGVAVGTQAAMAAATASLSPITSASQLASSTLSNAGYTLIVKSVDGLGNTIYGNVGTFGVDLDVPTQVADATSIAATGTINTGADPVVNITDQHSGSVNLRFRGTIHSVLEVDADAGTEMRCVSDNAGTVIALPAAGVCPWVFLPAGLTNIGGTTEQGTVGHFVAAPATANEGLYVYEVQGVDRAGNFASTLTFTTLVDGTVPGAVISTAAFDFTAGTVNITGTINENVDLASYDTRFLFPSLGGGAGGGAGADLPDQVPFVTPTAVDSYGLPLTGVLAVAGANSVSVRDIRDASGTIVPTSFGFFATDVAGNYAFTGQAITQTAGPGVLSDPDGSGAGAPAPLPLAQFNAEFDTNSATADNAGCFDRSAAIGACPDLNYYVEVTVDEEVLNPIATLYTYIVHPGADGVVDTADDYNVLVNVQAGGNASVTTGITERIFRFTVPLSGSWLTPNGAFRMFSIGVASNSSAISSDVVVLTIQP